VTVASDDDGVAERCFSRPARVTVRASVGSWALSPP
jgi:hypothetical protein